MKYYLDVVNDILKTDGVTGMWIREQSKSAPLDFLKLRTFTLSVDLKRRLPTHHTRVPSLLIILLGYPNEILS